MLNNDFQQEHDAQPEQAVWEQQEGESNLHFSWFHTFLWMGPERTIVGAYNTFEAKKSKDKQSRQQASGAWNKAAEQWHWRERSIAFDADQRIDAERRKTEARLRAERELDDREFEIRKRLIDRVEQMLNWPLVTYQSSEDGKHVTVTPAKWNFNTIARLIAAAEMLKSSADETTVTIRGKDLESGAVAFRLNTSVKEYSDEELLAIIAGGTSKKEPEDVQGNGKN